MSTPRRSGRTERRATVRKVIRMAVEMEASVWRSLYCWVTRRPRVPAGARAFSYVGPMRSVLLVFIILSAIEIPVLDLVLRSWPYVRIPILALGVWGLTFMIGLSLSLVVNPHAVGPFGIRVRHRTAVDFTLPWDAVRAVSMRRRTLPSSKAVQLSDTTEGAVVSVPVMSETNVDVLLAHPVEVDLPNGPTTVVAVRISADDADELVRMCREHLAGARQSW